MINLMQNEIVVPSIHEVILTHKQKFPKEGISKNVINFEREEDMIVMCLSLFVHDYIHDYNLASMHARVIKGNINRIEPDTPSLFEILGITIGNTIFKIIAYPVGGHRDISMYNDDQYEDVIKNEPYFTNFYNYLNSNEAVISMAGGAAKYEDQPQLITLSDEEKEKEKLLLFQEQGKEDLGIGVDVDVAEGIIKDTPAKTIAFNDVEDTLFVPSVIKSLNIEQIISAFEKNADFLDFHSALNTYIVTYLGYTELGEELGEETIEDKNEIANNAIKSSLKYIINDLKDAKKSMYVNFYGDMFGLLLDSYEIVMKKMDNKNPNPFDILNSPEMLYQFIIFYITYITVENYDKFTELIDQMNGGDGTDDEADEDDDALSPISSDPSLESESPVLKVGEKQIEEVPEYVFITHNNLLTTITRGMFIKLGIWKRIFFPDVLIEEITPDDYKFGPEQLNQISYDKLIELFPINPKTGGHRNNELLILEILILKRLLVEMSPSKTLTFGSKIDDDLKNYMDAFYLYNYNIKEPSQRESLIIDDDIINNPDFQANPELEKETEELFATCQEGCIDYETDNARSDDYGSDITEGGMRWEDRKDLIEMRKFENRGREEETPLTISPPPVSSDESVISVSPVELNPDIDIIEQKKPPSIPVLFNKMKKMYQNNMLAINQLLSSEIEPVVIDGEPITNLYDLLKLNQVLMHKKGTQVNIPAPKYKFVINNAANVGSNINGSRMFIPRSFYIPIAEALGEIRERVFEDASVNEEKLGTFVRELEQKLDENYNELETQYEIEEKELNRKKRTKVITIREYNRLLELKYNQKVFERTQIVPIENKLFLLEVLKENPDFYYDFEKNAATWFRDSQPIFGLYRSLQRGTFCPTSSMMDAMDNCSLKYNTTEPKEVGTSYSEIVYEGPDGRKISFGGVVLNYNTPTVNGEELTAKLHYTLDCNVGVSQGSDIMTLSTMGIKVSESNDLKARVAYRGVVSMIKNIYDSIGGVPEDNGIGYIQEMWKTMQYQYNPMGFNMLLSATALKTMGDYLQECQACFKWGGYVSNTTEFPLEMPDEIKDKLIYRSVSEGGRIIPYDQNTGNGLRLGIQGDRPSGFRSIYMLLNGEGAVNDQAITGYMFTSSTQNPSRSLLVARNKGQINSNGLKGSIIYVTRELQIPDRDELLRSLEFLNIKEKNRKVEGEYVVPEIVDSTIVGSEEVTGQLLVNPMSKIHPLKNSAYELLLDYNDSSFDPLQPEVEVENEKTDAEEAREQRKNQFKQIKGLDLQSKQALANKKARIAAEKQAEKERIAAEKQAEKERIAAEKIARDNAEKSARIMINNLRSDLTTKQKQSTKIASIPFDFLDQLKTDNKIPEGINSEIFDIIYEKALEDKRILDEAAAEEERKRQERAIKKEERAALKAKQLAYESSPEGIEEARQKAEEERRLAEAKEIRLADEARIKKEQDEARMLKISLEIHDLENEKGKKMKKEELLKQLVALRKELKQLEREYRKGGTLSDKKKYIHKITKRGKKNKNKLTKRHKKIKKPKRSRKLVS
jgi:hypothetical protein